MALRRTILAAAAAAALSAPFAALAQAPQFFRIGTGAAGGTYYPIGGLVANAISCPPGAPCGTAGATAGVPGLVAVAQATQGSIQNVNLIQSGNAESGFSQSDVNHWAFTGTGLTWTEHTADLAAWAGSEVQIRWIFSADQDTVAEGW